MMDNPLFPSTWRTRNVTMNRMLTAQVRVRAMNVTMTKTGSTQEPDRTRSETRSRA